MITTTLFHVLAIIITLSIYFKTAKISKLSSHQGIHLHNKAFLFFALFYILAFISTTTSLSFSKLSILVALTSPIQTYLITIAALYLSASLFWKNSKQDKTPLHVLALLITIINNFTQILPQALIVIYAFTSITSYTNYSIKKTKFSQVHLIAISLLLLSSIISLTNSLLLTSQAMTITAFSIFLYGTLKTIK